MTTVDRSVHGLGIDRLSDFAPDVAYGHAGSQAGYSALLTMLPERRAVSSCSSTTKPPTRTPAPAT